MYQFQTYKYIDGVDGYAHVQLLYQFQTYKYIDDLEGYAHVQLLYQFQTYKYIDDVDGYVQHSDQKRQVQMIKSHLKHD